MFLGRSGHDCDLHQESPAVTQDCQQNTLRDRVQVQAQCETHACVWMPDIRFDSSRKTTQVGCQGSCGCVYGEGLKQKYGIDYTETFSPVVKYVTLRMVVAITKYFNWPLDQLDVVTAFLYGVMKETVYCAVPEGVELDEDFNCLELVKAIYGLKQASRVWNETFDEFVRSIGFQASAYDPCLYIKIVDGHCILLLVYVDDVLVTGSSTELIARTKCDLKTRFEMINSGKCAFVLGIELVENAENSVTMCQRCYVNDIRE